jgi:hypothetical protein
MELLRVRTIQAPKHRAQTTALRSVKYDRLQAEYLLFAATDASYFLLACRRNCHYNIDLLAA